MEVAQVGVRTRAQAEAMENAAAAATATSTLAKRRKLNNEQVSLSSSYIQLTVSEGGCSGPGLELLDHDLVSTSCCSSNGSSERIEFVDLKVKLNSRLVTVCSSEFSDFKDESVEVEASTSNGCRERRGTTPSGELEAEAESGDMDSTVKPSSEEANSRSRSTVEKMPTETEIEDFFAEAEKKLLEQFSKKYNFDLAKEEPMEGRYKWVRLMP